MGDVSPEAILTDGYYRIATPDIGDDEGILYSYLELRDGNGIFTSEEGETVEYPCSCKENELVIEKDGEEIVAFYLKVYNGLVVGNSGGGNPNQTLVFYPEAEFDRA